MARLRKIPDEADSAQTRINIGESGDLSSFTSRHMTGKDPKTAALLLVKWVEWRYGKTKERHEHTGADGGPLRHLILERLQAGLRRVADEHDELGQAGTENSVKTARHDYQGSNRNA